jgi:GxxExxY protein
LHNDGFKVECEVALPVVYEKIKIDAGYRIDMIVNGIVIIENKTVEKLLPIHEAQLLTYLKMKNCKLGFLLNWNVPRMKDGIKRMVNNL